MPKKTDVLTAIMTNDAKTFLRRQRQHEELQHERELADIRQASAYAAAGVDIASASPLTKMIMATARREQQGEERSDPPLHPLTRDAIKQAMFRLDQVHWPHITKMRVKKYYPPDEPVPPQLPEVLMGQIRWYASMLFGAEANNYDSLRSDTRYGAWLASLADRVRWRVMTNLGTLENGDPDALIVGYHGLTYSQIEQELRTVLLEISGQYEQGIAPSQRKESLSNFSIEAAKTTPTSSRTGLRDSYLAAHPGIRKLDICWAAGQRYTEWKRWLRGALKDGSTPDQAFRALLGSGKPPHEYKTRPRPKGWK